jgi:hypothetical protein
MILLLGDSNFRNTMEEHGESLTAAIGEELKFFMVTSNESLKLQLENRDDEPKIVVIGTPLNEIVHKYNDNKKKGRAETIREVLEEQNKLVRQAASANSQVLFLLVPPFYRAEPQWISSRISLGVFYVKDFVGEDGPWNIAIANPVKITDADLSDDKVHLNKTGKEKLRKALEADILACKSNLGEEISQDWASQLSTSDAPTPQTMRKRPREEDATAMEEDEEGTTTIKKARLDTVLDRIDILVKELQEDRAATKAEVTTITQKVNEESKKVEDIQNTVEVLKKEVKNDVTFSAEVREDIDGLENENLKCVVIVRKLEASNVPKEKIALKAFIQAEARKLVAEILDQEASNTVRYAAPLYSYVDPSKKDNKEGLVTPFKIGFSTKDMAVKFREAAIKKSKEEGSKYKNTYFTFYQSFGTKIRSILMWGVCDGIKTPEKQAWVNMGAAKPTIQIKEGGKITKTLTFVQAMTEYKEKIPAKSLEEAGKLARKHFPGKAAKTFIVLKD